MKKLLGALLLLSLTNCAYGSERFVHVADKARPATVIITVMHENGLAGTGSGVLISPKGHILTCAHLFRRPGVQYPVTITLYNDSMYAGEVLKQDMKLDLALIKIYEKTPYLKLSAKESKIGEEVIVVGHPFGLFYTVTTGIISKFIKKNSSCILRLQVSAPINSGNSGGPILNLKGELVGISQSYLAPTPFAGFSGIGLGASVPMIVQFLRPYVGLEEVWK